MVDFKNQKLDLLLACNDYVKHRVQTAKQAIASARDAANNDAKSSAGDKYETTREMMNQEISRNEQLLSIATHMQQILNRIDEKRSTATIQIGSVVETNNGSFFIAISVGELAVHGQNYFVISPESPIGKNLIGKAVNEDFIFNGKNYQIKSVH
jgi:transcription elongation GreA/GreB family factor